MLKTQTKLYKQILDKPEFFGNIDLLNRLVRSQDVRGAFKL